jgi:hypothetical protein
MRPFPWLPAALAGAVCVALGCGSGSDLDRPEANQAPVTRPCNVIGDVCILPYPSSVFSVTDPATPTGVRVAIPQEAAYAGFPVDGFNTRDGFPPSTGIVTRFAEGVRADGLPSPEDRVGAYAASLASNAPILLANADPLSPHYGDRIPYFAEVIESEDDPSEALLVITPLTPLHPASRIAVIVTDGVRDPTGAPVTPSDTMSALLGDDRPEGELGALWDYYRDLRYLAERELGLRRAAIVQMWDFPTRSEEDTSADLLVMRDEVTAWLEDNPPNSIIVDTAEGPRQGTTRYDFEYANPIFRATWDGALERDAAGRPTIVRTDTLRGILVVPDAATGPLLPLVFGHGFGQSATGMLSLTGALDLMEGPYALALFDWDLHGQRGAGASAFIDLISPDTLEALAGVFQQSAVDELVLAAAVRALNDTGALSGRIDTDGHLYAGVSMGAVFGTVVTAIDPAIRASVLNVGGGGIINIVRFSTLFADLGVRDIFLDLVSEPGASATGLPADLDAEILLLVAQFAVDDGDSINYGRHLIGDRFPHMPADAPPIILQESLGDSVVPNFTTEALARAASLPFIEPAIIDVPGLDTATAPTLGAPRHGLTQFRVYPDGLAAHIALAHQAVQRQLLDLFASVADGDPDTDGNITYPCATDDGSCDLMPQ